MPATKVTLHQKYLAEGEAMMLEHVQNGWVQVFDVQYRGGSGLDQNYLVTYVTLEPATDKEAADFHESHKAGARAADELEAAREAKASKKARKSA